MTGSGHFLPLVSSDLLWRMRHAVASIHRQVEIVTNRTFAVAKVDNFDYSSGLLEILKVPGRQLCLEDFSRASLLGIIWKIKHDILRFQISVQEAPLLKFFEAFNNLPQ